MITNYIAAFLYGACTVVIGGSSPIHSILVLIVVFFLGSILLFFLRVEYFALLFLIVYVGAIVVLFLFIVMMLEIKTVNVSERLNDLFSFRNIILAFFLLQLLLSGSYDFSDISILNVFKNPSILNFLSESNLSVDYSSLLQRTDHLRAVGSVLFTEYKSGIMIVALILFLSMVGSIVMTLEDIKVVKTLKAQDANHQSLHQNFTTIAYVR